MPEYKATASFHLSKLEKKSKIFRICNSVSFQWGSYKTRNNTHTWLYAREEHVRPFRGRPTLHIFPLIKTVLPLRLRLCVDPYFSVRQFPRVKHKENYQLTFGHTLYLAWNVDRWLVPVKTVMNARGVHKPLDNSGLVSQPQCKCQQYGAW